MRACTAPPIHFTELHDSSWPRCHRTGEKSGAEMKGGNHAAKTHNESGKASAGAPFLEGRSPPNLLGLAQNFRSMASGYT